VKVRRSHSLRDAVYFVNCAKVGTAQSWLPSSNHLQFVIYFLKKSDIKTMLSCEENEREFLRRRKCELTENA